MQHPNKILKDYKRLHLLYEKDTVFTAFDTETTAVSPRLGRIIEIGAIKFNKNGIISTYEQLINPECIIPPFIENLTNISQSMVNCCPTIKNCLPEFLEFIGDTVLVAHNAQFDLNFLNAECEFCGLPFTKNKAIDTLRFSQWLYPSMERHKLDFLADVKKIAPGNAHRAFDDARVCMELFNIMIKESIERINF